MKKILLFLLTFTVYSVSLINPVLAGDMSNVATDTYNIEFETKGLRYHLRIRHSDKGDLLIFNNNTDISFFLFSDLQGRSQLLGPRSGQTIECGAESIVGSTFILSAEAKDFEETLLLKCGDSVVVRERG